MIPLGLFVTLAKFYSLAFSFFMLSFNLRKKCVFMSDFVTSNIIIWEASQRFWVRYFLDGFYILYKNILK